MSDMMVPTVTFATKAPQMEMSKRLLRWIRTGLVLL
jgi:hypothetical protein